MRAFIRRNFKRFILPGILMICSIILSSFALGIALDKINERRLLIDIKESELKQITSLVMEYKDIVGNNEKIMKRIGESATAFELLPFLEEISKKVGINEKISSMKPSGDGPDETSASFVFRDIDMDELVALLSEINASGRILLIKKMQLKVTDSKQKTLEASFVITALKFQKDSYLN